MSVLHFILFFLTGIISARSVPPPYLCPMFKCVNPGPCDVPYKTSTFTTPSGKVCYGCSYCPSSSTRSSRLRREGLFSECPLFKCIAPSQIPCDVPLKMGVFTTPSGRRCPSCYYCPTTA